MFLSFEWSSLNFFFFNKVLRFFTFSFSSHRVYSWPALSARADIYIPMLEY